MVPYKAGRGWGLVAIFFHFFIIIKVGHFEVLCFHEYSNSTVSISSISSFTFVLMSFLHCCF